ncbi:unnamed protein product [Heterosigma akashiwo]
MLAHLHKEPLYCLNVQLDVKPERRDEFLACIQANQLGTLTTEPLAVSYLFGEDTESPNTFHFFEQYLGREGFVAHTESPHFSVWEEFASTEPFTAPAKVSFYREDSVGTAGLGKAATEEFKLQAKKSLYCLNVQLDVKPERRGEFLACSKANQQGTLTTEPLAVTYLFGEDEESPNTFHFFEQYLGKEGFVAHTESPHFSVWEDFASSEPFTAPPRVSFYYEEE